ncbi:MAG: helix-turn-helix domain-containing protein [Pseudonocardiales bacterium]|nr:helix-turn-helix domain-containing protein [Pseudonocardiales bacterium]
MSMSRTGGRICPACRVAVLSRYNPDPLCATCVRASRDSVGVVPAWLWDSGPMREALARLDMPAFIAIFRSTSGFSQLELGSLVEGWSQSLVCRMERGERDTLYDIRKLLAFADALGMPRTALAPLILGRPDATLDSDGDVVLREVDPVDVNRRGFTTMAAGFATSAALPAPARVDAAHVRYLRAVLARLRSQDRTVGGGALLPQALRHFAHARRMLDESDYSATIGRELLVVTTDLGIDSAWLAYDANNQMLARQLYGEAALLADSAGDNAQRAYLYANMVQQSNWIARYTGGKYLAREALRFADRAADAARYEPSPTLHSLISLRRSLAHARLGDEVAFRSAITAAKRELDRGPHEADSWRTQFVSHSEVTGHEALGRAQLGKPTQAVQLYQSVLDDTARSPRDLANYRADLAGALVQAGDIEQAIAQGLMVLPDLGTTLTSGRVLQRLRPVRAAADTATAAEFRDRFDAAARALHAA